MSSCEARGEKKNSVGNLECVDAPPDDKQSFGATGGRTIIMLRHGCFGTVHRGKTNGTSGDGKIRVSAQLCSCFTVTYGSGQVSVEASGCGFFITNAHIFALPLLFVFVFVCFCFWSCPARTRLTAVARDSLKTSLPPLMCLSPPVQQSVDRGSSACVEISRDHAGLPARGQCPGAPS